MSESLKYALIIIVAVMAADLLIHMFWFGIVTRRYKMTSDKVTRPLKILHISDLHSCRYGKNQSRLIKKIKKASPDIVCMTGDIIDERKNFANALALADGIAHLYPCYYVYGNHEFRISAGILEWHADDFRQRGVKLLSIRGGEKQISQFEIGGQRITVCGIDDPSGYGFRRAVSDIRDFDTPLSMKAGSDSFSILLSHRPDLADYYADTKFDLVLSGHAHGGQWRIPLVMNGLYAPQQGLFPRYAGGLYKLKNKEWRPHNVRLCVSRGLGLNLPIPRIFNPPEIVVITVTNGKKR